MPVLNDFGEAAYQKVVQQLDAFAARLGIPKEIIRQYWSDTAHLPQTLDELKAWGMKPDREYGQIRYDQATGQWHPLGTGPTPGKTDQERGGFPHFINNNVGDAQRFQQVDASGNIFGGSWDPAFNAAHFDAQGRPIGGAPAGGVQRSASANPYAGTPYEGAWEQANPSGQPLGTGPTTPGTSPGATPPSPSAAYPPGVDPGSLPGADARRAIVDANAYGTQQELQARIDQAIRDYALARTQEQRNQAYLDLQRWQTELNKIQSQQKTVTDMATALLSAATTLGSRPQDYVKFNQAVSGGTDILDQITGKASPVAAFGGVNGQIQPGSVWDLLGRMGLSYPQTPATPAGVQPGATNPANPDLPAVPVPGTPGVPGALQPGATGGSVPGGTQTATGLPPSYEQALRELDQAAGGQWSGNRADKTAVAQAWWNADPSRRGRAMPAVAWG